MKSHTTTAPVPLVATNTSKPIRAGMSPVLATIILISITLIAAIGVAGFVFGLFGSFAITVNPSAQVTPHLYASASNVGIVNEIANFTVSVNNPYTASQNAFVVISSGGHVYQNLTYEIGPKTTGPISFSQELRQPGIWEVDAYMNKAIIGSYTFDVELNTDQAQLKIDQFGLNQQSLLISEATLGVAIASAVIALVSVTIALKARQATQIVIKKHDEEKKTESAKP